MVHRRRHEKYGAGSGKQDAGEKHGSLEGGRVCEVRLERRGQQKREQHLGAGQRNAQFIQKLAQLAIRLLLLRLTHRRTATRTGVFHSPEACCFFSKAAGETTNVAQVPVELDLSRHRDLEGRKWHPWVSRTLLALIAALLVVALFNVFGQRPTTSRVASSAAILSVYSPSRVRGGLLYTARFHVTALKNLKNAALVLDPGWIEGMQVNSINPQPLSESSQNGKIYLDLGHIPVGQSAIYFIEFQVDPTNVGHRSQDVRLDEAGRTMLTIHRTITIYP